MYPKISHQHRNYRFDGFEVDVQTGILSREGERIPIQELPFQLLAALLQRPGELVSREELRECLWPPGVHLDFEAAISTAARKLRQALGDNPRAPRYIETHAGRGYRFLSPVERVEAHPSLGPRLLEEGVAAPTPGQGRIVPFRAGPSPEPAAEAEGGRRTALKAWAGFGLALALAGSALLLGRPWRARTAPPGPVPSVLALPTRVMGPPGSAFLAEAIPDTLSTFMGSVKGLDTKLPPTSLEVDRVQGDLGKIAQAYKVDTLLITSVTVEGDRLFLNLQLVEAATRNVRWASRFEGTRDTYNQLVRQAAGDLVLALRPGLALAQAAGPGEDSGVELALQEGRYFLNRYGDLGKPEDCGRAKLAFDRALRLAPASSKVMTAMAGFYWGKCNRDGDAKAVEAGGAWARRALDRDPRDGAAWAALAGLEAFKPRMDLARAIEWAVKGIRFAPMDRGVNGVFGSVAPGVTFMVVCGQRARELDPLGNAEAGMTATGLIILGRAGEALPILDRALAESPEAPFLLSAKGYALIRLGRLPEARAILERNRPEPSSTLSFTEDFRNQVHFALVAAQGDADAARTLAGNLVPRYLAPTADITNLSNAAVIMAPDLVRLGRGDLALDLLARTVDAGSPPPFDWLCEEAGIQALRSDPRFRRIHDASLDGARTLVRHLDEAKAAGELPLYLDPPLARMKALADPPVPAR